MDRKIRDMLNEYDIGLQYSSLLEDEGFYIPELNIIVVNSDLNEVEQLKVILHELTHAANDREDAQLYERIETLRQKMECEANKFMVSGMLDEYMNEADLEPYEVNYTDFLAGSELEPSYDTLVIKLLKQKIMGTSF
ncbi:ImmA/IrrE family metallo-endopeptidase [Ligilactobacillus pobuzihii]|uniref:ImmA/IrrE family metallo-endopeptidase n=1 Tax=Ligilactobacillus pobuzihii TaxID=449659 RepID=UPI0019D03404|nr:ImmA/IrrE family metallo-endopeptidase [Ligilactobacillus pobuzihii]MBN7273692.1 ImmA/IrrE family metallo-endopeptidase [Ligilactobacillus pobuzihii]